MSHSAYRRHLCASGLGGYGVGLDGLGELGQITKTVQPRLDTSVLATTTNNRKKTPTTIATPKKTVPTIPRTLPAFALPLLLGSRRPSSIALTSRLPIYQANGPRMPQTTIPRIPNTRAVVDSLPSGYCCGGVT